MGPCLVSMQIFIFGNPDVALDALPLKILPALKKQFPEVDFVHLDPNEDWDVPDDLIVIDTVLGLKEIHVFDSLDDFEAAPQISMHDFDALANLRLMMKIGRIKKIKIIGLPPMIAETDAVEAITNLLSKSELSN